MILNKISKFKISKFHLWANSQENNIHLYGNARLEPEIKVIEKITYDITSKPSK